MRIFITLLFVASLPLFTGCASMPAGQPSSERFYTFKDSEGTGLIRAFQNENTTVLQFTHLSDEDFGILDGKGHQLKYERVGEHYVILPGTHRSLTVFTRNASVKITGGVKTAPMPEPKTLPAPPLAEKVATSADQAMLSLGLAGYVVQVWSCTDRYTAEKLKGGLESKGYNAEIKVRSTPKLGTVFGVRLHPMGKIAARDAMKSIRRGLGVRPRLIVIPPDQLAAYESGR